MTDADLPAPDPDEVRRLADARQRVLERIADAAARARRDASTVRLVAVSKTVPAERVRAGIAAGLTVLGENRVQEASAKVPEAPGATWHLVGPLQANKARRAIELFDVIESVHSTDLAARLARIAAEEGTPAARVLLQVNVDRDPAKSGFIPEDLERETARLAEIAHLDVLGLMTIGHLAPDPEEARPTFAALRELRDGLRQAWPGLGEELSMGMTDDFEVAVEEGATIVRVGRALFGERPHDHDHGAGASHQH